MGLFGKSKSKVEIPGYIKDASQHNIQYAQDAARLGYVPHYGLDVAGFGPAQNAATNALGIGGTDLNFAQPMQGPGGTFGFSSYPLYAAQHDMWNANAPGQAAAYRAMFMDPVTGDAAVRDTAGMQAVAPVNPSLIGTPGAGAYSSLDRDYEAPIGAGHGGEVSRGGNLGFGGYSGIGDMFDGGGPGASGDRFEGPVSGVSNRAVDRADGLFGGFSSLFGG